MSMKVQSQGAVESPPWDTTNVVFIKSEEGDKLKPMLNTINKTPATNPQKYLKKFKGREPNPFDVLVAREARPTLLIYLGTSAPIVNGSSPPPSNDSCKHRFKQPPPLRYEVYTKRECSKPYSPTNVEFLQNLCPELKSWLEAHTPIPNNVRMLSEKKGAIKASLLSHKRRKNKGNYIFRKSNELITPWYKIRGKSKLYPWTSGWNGYRVPSAVDLIRGQLREARGLELSPVLSELAYMKTTMQAVEETYLSFLKRRVKAKDYALDTSTFDTMVYPEVQQDKILLLEHNPVPKEHYRYLDNSDDSLRYSGWLFSCAQYSQRNRCFDSYFIRRKRDLQYMWHIDEYWFHLLDEFTYNSSWEIEASERSYELYLKKYDTLNPHVDYLPEQVESKSVFKQWREDGILFKTPLLIGLRFPLDSHNYSTMGCKYYNRKSIKDPTSALPAARFSRITNENAAFTTDELWLRFVTYITAYHAKLISYPQLKWYGEFIFSDKYKELNSNKVKEVMSSEIFTADQYIPALSKPHDHSVYTKDMVEKLVQESTIRIESNRAAAEAMRYAPHASGHSHKQVFSFVMEKGWKGFKKLSTGLLVPESFDERKGCVVIDNNTSMVLRTG